MEILKDINLEQLLSSSRNLELDFKQQAINNYRALQAVTTPKFRE